MKTYTLITGATSGIGLELARIAAREGHNLVLVARSASQLKTVADELQSPAVSIKYLALDLTKPRAASTLSAFIKKNKLTIDQLINNAGIGDYGEFASSKLERQLTLIDLNIRSLTEITHLFLPAMLRRGNGKIMNLGSVASFLPGPNMSVYYASKNYVLSFSRALSEELRGTGVTVTCLCPGPTKTGFGKAAHVSKTHSTANPKVTAREVAEFGWYELQNGTPVAVYGLQNKLMLQLLKIIPRNAVAGLVKKIQR